MQVEVFSFSKHYSAVKSWWEQQNHHIVSPDNLSTRGIVIERDNKPFAACWLYVTDSATCFIDHAVVAPELRREERGKAMDMAISAALELARSLGFNRIAVTLEKRTLMERLISHGFGVASDKTIIMARAV